MCKPYCPLHIHSYFSLLDGLSSPDEIAKRIKEIGCSSYAITDHGSIAGLIEHFGAAKKHGLKFIPGVELYICENDPKIKDKTNDKRWHLTIIAKNNEGIRDLTELVTWTNRPEHFYRKPRIDLNNLAKFAKRGNLICLSGCLAGMISESLFVPEIEISGKIITGSNAACRCGDDITKIEYARSLLRENWKDHTGRLIEQYIDIFGKENFYIEIQTENMIAQDVTVECLRQLSKDMQIPSVCALDAHYTSKEDAEDHRILLYSQMHTTAEQQESLKNSGEDTMSFFFMDTFYIYSPEEMSKIYTDREMESSLEIADRVKFGSIGSKPKLPKFKHNNEEVDSNEFLKNISIESAKDKLSHLSPDQKKVYWARLKRELSIIREAKLSDYFLIVYDACKFVDSIGAPRGVGRGSGAGSLVNYLLGVTQIDPIKYDLYFERFYNASRNIPPHFDVDDKSTFMKWYGENFENLENIDTEKAKAQIRNLVKNNKKINTVKLKREAEWIDTNSPRMWAYLLSCSFLSKVLNDKSNSYISYACGLSESEPSDNLIFNSGQISLPDIDTDIGVETREIVIKYLKEKWGEDRVAQMVTFGRLQGKAALKEVFRAQPELVRHLMKVKAVKEGKSEDDINMTPHDLCNDITRIMPDEAAITDDLQQARESEPNYGIIDWSIHNIDAIAEAYKWFQPLFDQARRIEGTYKNQSKHAAGVLISDRPISELCPMVYSAKDKDIIAGFEMHSAEKAGLVKFDFLGVSALDKLWYCKELINKG